MDDRFHDARERRRCEQAIEHSPLFVLPGEPDRHVEWNHGIRALRRVGEQNGAIEPARAEDGDIIHQITKSPNHQVTKSPSHQITKSLNHQIPRLPYFPITKCILSPSASSSATVTGCWTTTASASIRTGTTRSWKSKSGPTGWTRGTWWPISATSSVS